jgi:glycosyltransferase involved in cell wall biosynthesis
LVEAASCGIPCVSVSVGEIPFIWKDEEQMLFAKRDAADFA